MQYGDKPFYYNSLDHTFIYTLDELRVNNYASETFGLQLGTPIFHINNKLNFDLATLVVLSKVKFDATYRFKVIRDGSQIGYTSYYTDNVISDKWSFFPGLNTNYYFTPKVQTTLGIYFNLKLMIYLTFGYSIL